MCREELFQEEQAEKLKAEQQDPKRGVKVRSSETVQEGSMEHETSQEC